MRKVIVLMLVLAATAGVAGCGTSAQNASHANAAATSTPQGNPRAPTTRFVLHAGLAFGAFHRYIYKPYKSGAFKNGSRTRKALILAKGAAAGAFSYHELKLASKYAHASPKLAKLVGPVDALAAKMQSVGNSLKHGQISPAAIEQAQSGSASLNRDSSGAGAPIKDKTPPPTLQPTG